jgi:ribonuclease PH
VRSQEHDRDMRARGRPSRHLTTKKISSAQDGRSSTEFDNNSILCNCMSLKSFRARKQMIELAAAGAENLYQLVDG